MLGSGLFTYYKNIVDTVFFGQLGKPVTVYLDGPPIVTTGSPVLDGYFGQALDGMPDAIDSFKDDYRIASTGARYSENIVSTGIVVRVYWDLSPSVIKNLNVRNGKKACQIDSQTADYPILSRAKFIEVQDNNNPQMTLRCTLVKSAVPYGLGPNHQYHISYWETATDG